MIVHSITQWWLRESPQEPCSSLCSARCHSTIPVNFPTRRFNFELCSHLRGTKRNRYERIWLTTYICRLVRVYYAMVRRNVRSNCSEAGLLSQKLIFILARYRQIIVARGQDLIDCKISKSTWSQSAIRQWAYAARSIATSPTIDPERLVNVWRHDMVLTWKIYSQADNNWIRSIINVRRRQWRLVWMKLVPLNASSSPSKEAAI